MTDRSNQSEKIAEVVRLAMLLARHVLATLVMERSIPTQQAVALAEAAELLRNHDVGWPPLLSQVVYELGADRGDRPTGRTRDLLLRAQH